MKEVNGKPSNFNIFDLTKVSDLIEFDGPLLSHFINDKNEDFLFLWCDVDQAYNRWVIFKVENFKLLSEDITVLDMMKDKVLYCVDIDKDVNYHNIKEIDLAEYLSF